MPWRVATYISETGRQPVQDWVRSLDPEARAAVSASIKLLARTGPELGMPDARNLGDDLWELRVHDSQGIYRIIYFHWVGHTYGLLHGFTKKTRKTPKDQIMTAKQRRATWLARRLPE